MKYYGTFQNIRWWCLSLVDLKDIEQISLWNWLKRIDYILILVSIGSYYPSSGRYMEKQFLFNNDKIAKLGLLLFQINIIIMHTISNLLKSIEEKTQLKLKCTDANARAFCLASKSIDKSVRKHIEWSLIQEDK